MDQQKIGCFIKSLRLEKGLTQEQLAETLGVTNRSVSRWENGNNLPDLSVLLELAKYFEVDVGDILDGERRQDSMDKQTDETIQKIADYEQKVREGLTRILHRFLILGATALALAIFLRNSGFIRNGSNMTLANTLEGIGLGELVCGIVYTSKPFSRFVHKIWTFKMKLLGKVADTQ